MKEPQRVCMQGFEEDEQASAAAEPTNADPHVAFRVDPNSVPPVPTSI
jgi:hypothetical protein